MQEWVIFIKEKLKKVIGKLLRKKKCKEPSKLWGMMGSMSRKMVLRTLVSMTLLKSSLPQEISVHMTEPILTSEPALVIS